MSKDMAESFKNYTVYWVKWIATNKVSKGIEWGYCYSLD